jgi:hypothetical protein
MAVHGEEWKRIPEQAKTHRVVAPEEKKEKKKKKKNKIIIINNNNNKKENNNNKKKKKKPRHWVIGSPLFYYTQCSHLHR